MKTTIRIAALTAALLFGVATVLPLTAAPADAAQTMKTMPKKHMSMGNASVKAAQQALNKGGANLAEDGKYGPKTKKALMSFQKANGLKATGRLDKATKTALKIG